MTVIRIAAAILVTASLAPMPAQAADKTPAFRPVLGVTATGGGHPLSVVSADGGTQRLSAGGLFHLFGGAEYTMASMPLTFQANVGYHFDYLKTGNGTGLFTRMPVELMAFWNTSDQLRFGVGLRKAMNAQLRGSGQFSETSVNGKLGAVLQAEYALSQHWSLHARYVDEQYKSGNLRDGGRSGNHGGIGATYRF